MRRILLVTSAYLCLSATVVAQTPVTHHVDPFGDDTAAGTMADPLATIGEALARSATGDTVSLADGVYRGAGNRDLALPAHPVVVRSAGGVRDDCIVDCEGAGRAFTVDAGQDTTTVIEGVTIRDGWSASFGGAIHVGLDSNLLVRDCLFLENRAANGGAISCNMHPFATGGPYPRIGSGPVIRGCRFEGNEASGSGGAILGDLGARPWIADSEFVANSCGSLGGAVSLTYTCGGFIQRSTFIDNTAGYSGGGLDVSFEQETLTVDCRFEGNSAPHGGAIANTIGYSKKSAEKAPPGGPDFERCTFTANSAEEGGAAYFWHRCLMDFTECVFTDNEATVAGGAAMEYWENEVTYTRCLFARNSAPEGGVFRRIDGDPAPWYGPTYLVSCTLVDNHAASGSAISSEHGVDLGRDWYGYSIENTVISHNTGGPTFTFTNVAPPLFSCTDLYANEGGDWSGIIAPQVDLRGNFSADPCYCDPGTGDYHLSGDSWCLPGNHPWGCAGLVGAFEAGCDPNGCNGPVATLVAGFQVEAYAGRVTLSWRVERGMDPQRFKLEAAAGADRWPVSLVATDRGRFAAVDEAPELLKADAASYTLYLEEAAGDWREVWTERVHLPAAVRRTRLTSVHPNPFNPLTIVSFDLAAPDRISLAVYDVSGRRIRALRSDESLPRGSHQVAWDGRDDAGRAVAAGVYLVRLAAGTTLDTERVMLIK